MILSQQALETLTPKSALAPRNADKIQGSPLTPRRITISEPSGTFRDGHMERMDAHYPGVDLAVHKSYPTPAHLAALKLHPLSHLHRRSFGPVRQAA
jgi:ribonuclease HII